MFWSETYMTDIMSENCRKQFVFNSLPPWLSDSLADKVYTLLSDHPCSLPVSPLCVSYTAVTKLNPPSVHPCALLGLQGHTLRTANSLRGMEDLAGHIRAVHDNNVRLSTIILYIFSIQNKRTIHEFQYKSCLYRLCYESNKSYRKVLFEESRVRKRWEARNQVPE